jgi:hypothetical protein
MAVNRLTPLGGREWGIAGTDALLPTAQFLGMALIMLVLPAQVARWRLNQRVAGLGLANGKSLIGWFAAMCAALFVPLVGWAAPVELRRHDLFPLVGALVAVPVLWLAVNPLWVLFGRSKYRVLTSGVLARALLPVYSVAMLLMVAAAPFHKAAERYWFRKDTLLRMDSEFPSMSPYEVRVAQQLRKETREILGLEP